MKTLLFNPFETYSDRTLLISGIGITLFGSLLGFWLNTRFVGVLNVTPIENVSFFTVFLDNLLNILSLTILLFVTAKYLNKKTRLLDILTTSMLSRAPYYLLSLGNINGFIRKETEKILLLVDPENMGTIPTDNLVFVLIFALISLVILAWYIALLYNGFKVAANAKKMKSIILFSIAIVIAHIFSLLLIHNLN